MATVNALGYLRMNAPDLGAWRTYATDLLGLQVAEKVSDGMGDGAVPQAGRPQLPPRPRPQ